MAALTPRVLIDYQRRLQEEAVPSTEQVDSGAHLSRTGRGRLHTARRFVEYAVERGWLPDDLPAVIDPTRTAAELAESWRDDGTMHSARSTPADFAAGQ